MNFRRCKTKLTENDHLTPQFLSALQSIFSQLIALVLWPKAQLYQFSLSALINLVSNSRQLFSAKNLTQTQCT